MRGSDALWLLESNGGILQPLYYMSMAFSSPRFFAEWYASRL